jgi:hypothetical protein
MAWSPDLGMFAALVNNRIGPRKSGVYTSTDGKNWSEVNGTPLDNAAVQGGMVWSSLLGEFIGFGASNDYSVQIMSSSDGSTWTAAPSAMNGDFADGGAVLCALETDTTLYFGGWSDGTTGAPTVVSTTDLSTFTDEGCPLDEQVSTLMWDGGTTLVAVGEGDTSPGSSYAIAITLFAAPTSTFRPQIIRYH